jgi:hypothetical protein
MSTLRTFALVLVAAAMLGAETARDFEPLRNFESDFDDNKKEWKEIEAKIPAYPKDASLLPFQGGGASPHRFFIDAESLSIGADGVVRYTLVVKTAGGATNVTFEGVRCDMRQQKYYAIGHPGGNWTRARSPQWRRIEYQEVNRHHGVLYSDYLCAGTGSNRAPVKNVAEAVQRLKYGSPLPGQQP